MYIGGIHYFIQSPGAPCYNWSSAHSSFTYLSTKHHSA